MVPSALFFHFFFSNFWQGGGGGMWGLYLQLSIKAMFMCLKTQIYYLTCCSGFEITYHV